MRLASRPAPPPHAAHPPRRLHPGLRSRCAPCSRSSLTTVAAAATTGSAIGLVGLVCLAALMPLPGEKERRSAFIGPVGNRGRVQRRAAGPPDSGELQRPRPGAPFVPSPLFSRAGVLATEGPSPRSRPGRPRRRAPGPAGQRTALPVPEAPVGGGPFQGLVPFAPALLFLGVCEGHTRRWHGNVTGSKRGPSTV